VLRDAARSAEFHERLRRKELHRKELLLKLGRILRRASRTLRMGRICLHHVCEQVALAKMQKADVYEIPTSAEAGELGAEGNFLHVCDCPAPLSDAPATPTRSRTAARAFRVSGGRGRSLQPPRWEALPWWWWKGTLEAPPWWWWKGTLLLAPP